MSSSDDKVCKEEQSSKPRKVEAKKSNPDDNACAMPDRKSCTPKNKSRTDCFKLDDCDEKKKDVKKKVNSALAGNRCKRKRSKDCLECKKEEECLPCHGLNKADEKEEKKTDGASNSAKCKPKSADIKKICK